MIGPFFDYYFGSSLGRAGGFHLQGSPALAVLNGFRPEQGRYDDDRRVAIGAGLMAGFGYEWWVEKQWGLGVLARLQRRVSLKRARTTASTTTASPRSRPSCSREPTTEPRRSTLTAPSSLKTRSPAASCALGRAGAAAVRELRVFEAGRPEGAARALREAQ